MEAKVSNNTDRKRAILKEKAELRCISNLDFFQKKVPMTVKLPVLNIKKINMEGQKDVSFSVFCSFTLLETYKEIKSSQNVLNNF